MSYQQDCFLDYVESNDENVCNECGNTQSEGEELTKGFCADCYEFYSNDLENSTETLTPESERRFKAACRAEAARLERIQRKKEKQ